MYVCISLSLSIYLSIYLYLSIYIFIYLFSTHVFINPFTFYNKSCYKIISYNQSVIIRGKLVNKNYMKNHYYKSNKITQ